MGYMKVTCPKCQFENQADSSRVVCARCATIIEVRMDQGFDSNGKRQTARLPFTSGGLSGGSQRFSQSDVYATRIGDDFDDVLDVPIQSQSGYQAVDEPPPVPVFEDVFTNGQNQDQPPPYDFAAYDKPSAPLDAFVNPGARPRDPQDYIEPVEQDFVGWPVMPEGAEEEEEAVRSGRGGLFLRLGLIFGLLGVVSFWAYYFLGDYLTKIRTSKNRAQPTVLAEDKGVSNQPSPTAPEQQVTPEASENKSSAGNDEVSPEPATQTAKRLTLPPVTKGGVVKPKETSPIPKPPTSRGPELPSKGGNLTIQVGAFRDQGEAEAKASGLNAATGGDFHVVRAEIPGMGVWYRVQQSSGFDSREAAMSYGNRLRAKNLVSSFIVKPK
jgi:hypothetical protein